MNSQTSDCTLCVAEEVERMLWRLAHELQERHPQGVGVVLCGIPTRGVWLTKRLLRLIEEQDGSVWAGRALDVGPYRDDVPRTQLPEQPLPLADPESVAGRDVVLVDDVLYHGRTARAALVALGEIARPRTVELLVLVDRGHRELPLRATFVGRNLPTHDSDRVLVRLREEDGVDQVLLRRGVEGQG